MPWSDSTAMRDAELRPLADVEPLDACDSFEHFFLREYAAVVGLATVLSGDSAVGEDLAQEAFAAAYRRWERLRGYDRPGAWVRRVVANRAASAARRRVRELMALVRLGSRRQADYEPVQIGDEEFWETLRELPKRQAQCLALCYLEDRSVSDVAQTLGIAESTVRVHLHQGRRELARRLAETVEDVP
jgi:RNA polymerase sigma-70 factor, ECF subfamily